MFSGYFHDFASKFSDKNTVYALEAGWTASAWNYTYNYIFPVAHKSTLITQDEAKYKHFYGATLVLKVEAMHRKLILMALLSILNSEKTKQTLLIPRKKLIKHSLMIWIKL